MRPLTVRPVALAGLLAGVLAACQGDPTGARLRGVYTLRSVGVWTPPYAELPVPGSAVGAAPGDTIRYLAGAFVLTANGRWHERVVREVVGGGSVRTDTLGGDGTYRVTPDAPGRTLLDLYPGKVYIANINAMAVISGDTLDHAPWVFVR